MNLAEVMYIEDKEVEARSITNSMTDTRRQDGMVWEMSDKIFPYLHQLQ